MSTEHLFVDSNGVCLICFGSIPTTKPILWSYTTKEAFNAFQRYIKVNPKALDNVSPMFLQSLSVTLPRPLQGDDDLHTDVNVHVELCFGCTTLVENFHERYKIFELNRLQLDSCLQELKDVMKNATQDFERTSLLKGMALNRPQDLGNAVVATALREKTVEKCSSKLRLSNPRLFLSRLTSFKTPDGQTKPNITSTVRTIVGVKSKKVATVSKARFTASKIGKAPNSYSRSCSYCPKKLSTNKNLQNHTFLIHSYEMLSPYLPETLSSVQCGVVVNIIFKSLKSRGRLHQCLFCSKWLASKSKAKIHIMRKHLLLLVRRVTKDLHVAPREPPEVSKTSHYRRRSTPPPKNQVTREICGVCKKSLGSKKSLECHMLVHSPTAEEFTCPYCTLTSIHFRQVKTHMVEMHTVEMVIKSLPGTVSRDKVATAVDVVLAATKEDFVQVETSDKKRHECLECHRSVSGIKRHVLGTHFDIFVDKVQNLLTSLVVPTAL